jgi:hypothetical protein
VNKDKPSVVIALVLGIGLIAVGIAAIVAPQFSSSMFGIAAVNRPAWAYLRATGLRDIAIGSLLFAFIALRSGPRALGLALMILSLIPIGDAINVWMNAGAQNVSALALHSVSAIAFFMIGFWLRVR